MHTLQYMAIKKAWISVLSRLYRACAYFHFSGAAHGGPAYSGNHRKDSVGNLPHEARTTQ